MDYPKVQPGELPHSRCSLRNIALVLPGVRGRGRPHSLGEVLRRDGCLVIAARIASWLRACSRVRTAISLA